MRMFPIPTAKSITHGKSTCAGNSMAQYEIPSGRRANMIDDRLIVQLIATIRLVSDSP